MRVGDLRRALAGRPFSTLDLSRVSPAYRSSEGALSEAAVLVPVFEKGGAGHVLLMRRRPDLRRHPGQISFPGGTLEAADADALSAALREAHEEVGIAPADVEVLGRLGEALVVTTGFRLTPWVGAVPYPYRWSVQADEVAGLLEIPIAELERPGAHRTEIREAYGMQHEVHFFTVGDGTVWGATARVLAELVSVWRDA
jgi:8-oxo-dGTP pyrophosphatase MutT (NUDIX family)